MAKGAEKVREDFIVLKARGSFWFSDRDGVDKDREGPGPKGARFVTSGEQFGILRGSFAHYGAAAEAVAVSGIVPARPATPPTPGPPPAQPGKVPFTERILEKGESAGPALDKSTKFACGICGTVFTAAKGLELHNKNAHPPEAE